MPTFTTNFAWQKPLVNNAIDQDQWGIQLNSNLDAQDTLVYALATTSIGTSRPSYAAAGTLWINNSSNPYPLYVYSGVTDILIGNIDTVANTFTPSGAAELTTKGDLLTRNTTNLTRLGVGTDGQVLVADSTQATGLKWDSASSHIGAWANIYIGGINSSPITINASSNIASVTRNGGGVYTFTFTNPLPSAYYVVSGTVQRVSSDRGSDAFITFSRGSSTRTTTSCSILLIDGSGNGLDYNHLNNFNVMFVGG